MTTERPGQTDVISVSVTTEFTKLIKEYKMSPTEVFRKGMAVMLFELDVPRYQSETNKKRTEYSKAFMEEYENNIKLQKLFNDILSFGRVLEENKK